MIPFNYQLLGLSGETFQPSRQSIEGKLLMLDTIPLLSRTSEKLPYHQRTSQMTDLNVALDLQSLDGQNVLLIL